MNLNEGRSSDDDLNPKTNVSVLCFLSPTGTTIESIKESFENIAHPGLSATYVKLTRNQMEFLPSQLFKGITVTHVIAHYNNLSYIEEGAFSGLEDKLESIDLSQNALTRVGLQHLKKDMHA